MKNKGITEITIQPEFPKLNEEDLGDGLKNLIQVNFKNNYFVEKDLVHKMKKY